MPVTVVASSRAEHQKKHQNALISGLRKYGIEAVGSHSVDHVNSSIVACWGWRNGKYLRAKGQEVLVMERGYLGDRFSYTSLAWNGLNGHAEFPDSPEDGGKRFDLLGLEFKPWKYAGEYALILGQVPNDASLQGKDLVPWYTEQARKISEYYNIPVHFRPHPDLKKRGIKKQVIEGTIESKGSLEDALEGAAFSVCYNSNSSVDSVMAGVPCVVGDQGTMAYDMCSPIIEHLIRPDRKQWAYKLAQKQWLISEIEDGTALKEFVCRLGA